MPFYTICSTDKQRTLRPCAILFSQTRTSALLRIRAAKRMGSLIFLPEEANLSVRLSSRRETLMYQNWMTQSGPVPATGTDPSRTSRAQRLELSFWEKLWREGVK